MPKTIDQIDQMTEQEQSAFLQQWAASFVLDRGDAAQRHLEKGNPVYYREEDMPAGLVVREWPDRRRELVEWSGDQEVVVRELAPAA